MELKLAVLRQLLWVSMLVVALSISLGTEGGADTWQALAHGRHNAHFGVKVPDPFSPNSLPEGPSQTELKSLPQWLRSLLNDVELSVIRKWHPTGWINQNWLSGLLFYRITQSDNASSAIGHLYYLKVLLYILIIFATYAYSISLGLRPWPAALASCLALWVGRSFYTIRADELTKFFVPVFLTILVLSIRKRYWIIWAIVPLAALWTNMHGAFIYMFMVLIPFVLMNILNLYSKNTNGTTLKGLIHTFFAALVALGATVLFSPYRLSNITHILIINMSKDARWWRSIMEWHPVIDKTNNPVGDVFPFLMLLGCILFFVLIRYVGFAVIKKFRNVAMPLPQIPLSMLAIIILTLYMGMRFRRFIPIASIAACPVMVFIAQDTLRRFPRLLKIAQIYIPWFATVLTVWLIIWTGFRFNQVYIQPWPYTQENPSFFNRMMETHLDPVSVVDFFTLNNVQGLVLNSWEEGSNINWLQKPDEVTGINPVQVYIDGRAQVAYSRSVYDRYSSFWIGGQHGMDLYRKGHKPQPFDLYQMGLWLDRELKKDGVNLVLVPFQYYRRNLLSILKRHTDWRTVYRDPRHTLLADMTTAQGKRLFQGIKNGNTRYPDVFLNYLNRAEYLFNYGTTVQDTMEGFELAKKAFAEFPSSLPMILLSYQAFRWQHLQIQSIEFCETVVQNFRENITEYEEQPGFHARLNAMSMAARFLGEIGNSQNEAEGARAYAADGNEWKNMAEKIENRFIWQ